MKYLGHTKDGKCFTGEENSQELITHLKNVSNYAEKFAMSFDAGEMGALLGLVHDLGKYQINFQDRIRGRSKVKVDHATLGAKVLAESWKEMGWLHGMVVAGHHTGLKDSGCGSNMGDNTYSSRINNYQGQDTEYSNEINIPSDFKPKMINCDNETMSFAFATYFKMLFSCLVDADWTDTEEYITDISRDSLPYTIQELDKKLISGIPANNGSFINNIRAEILKDCQEASQREQGLFTLTVPTGGGKTLSSLSFALQHALKHNLKRIIYVIPYTSIIEQNADVIANILGKEFVLEHHSQVDETKGILGEDDIEEDIKKRIKWASENWDIPIILTTNVQFFESFFSNKPSKARKLHNIAESVVIFDEAQMLPRELLSPSMYAISELVTNYKVTAILCSATQPAISQYKYEKLKISEIIGNPGELAKKLKRVEYEVIGKKSDEDILEMFAENRKTLCIVNSRKHAYALYKLVSEDERFKNIYHLSTLMHCTNRREVLKKVKERLEKNDDVILIATSLVEAGVDIDFPVVMRSIAGIDNIIQAGGRANREGKLKKGRVLVFEPTSDAGKIPKVIQSMASLTKEVIAVLGEEAFEMKGVTMYFENLYHASSSDNILDSKNILDEFEIKGNSYRFNFETVAKKYKIIEDNTENIIINLSKESKELTEELRQHIFKRVSTRKLQQYSVSIYKNEYQKLLEENALEVLDSGFNILNNNQYYKGETGLDIFTDNNKNAECSII
ncbi:CRISPR-associated helicase Cas3' [Acetobacterium paludosum]|uniref:CRISPR-associated helicase Cas3 n=1 Tax=Acetobacterium paludosum TaxID=52693 RepID=A0A923KWL2_9FIRM|nr:CRISPR-associated helicase Cas3' [Acetobacterium paludosum]MBC3888183.1 CRISPR-associated helicase Cas3' [Acetobacterium paludosum]